MQINSDFILVRTKDGFTVQTKNCKNSFLLKSTEYYEELACLVEALKAEGGRDILVVVGGIIPSSDYEFLYKRGVSGIFGPGTVITDSANKVLNALFENRK